MMKRKATKRVRPAGWFLLGFLSCAALACALSSGTDPAPHQYDELNVAVEDSPLAESDFLSEVGPSPIGEWDQRLEPRTSGVVAWLTQFDLIEAYVSTEDGGFQPVGESCSLLRVLDGRGTIRLRDGTRYVFRPFDDALAPGKLASIVDRHDRAISFEYRPDGHLETVTDRYGRAMSFEYRPDGHLEAVTDWHDRRIELDSQGRIVKVTEPVDEIVQSYEYDMHGSVIRAARSIREFDYDSIQRFDGRCAQPGFFDPQEEPDDDKKER